MTAQQNVPTVNAAFTHDFPSEVPATACSVPVIERLPFRIRVVANESDLLKAVRIRQSAYARHVPAFARQLEQPEPADREHGSVVLLAESKLDGSALGTMRMQTNRYRPLKLEESVELPDWLQDCSLVEATRLGVGEGAIGRVVKTALFKAYYLYALDQGIDWMVITARKPLDRQYEMMLFHDVFEKDRLIPMRHVGDMPHRVMASQTATVKRRWTEAKHPQWAYVWDTHHPDIDVRHDDFAAFGGTIATTSWLSGMNSHA